MQTTGYIEINGQILLVLARQKKITRQLKIRKSGGLGVHFIDEEIYLKEYNPDLITALKNGNVIEL